MSPTNAYPIPIPDRKYDVQSQMVPRIPLARPALQERERAYLADCIDTGWISSRGSFIDRFEALNAEYYRRAHAISTSSGTSALHLALLALGIGAGDSVLVPELTFAATINAVLHTGATPIIVPVSRRDWNIDCDRLSGYITLNTRAVIAVHLYGKPCNMDALLEVARRHDLRVIEDCAQAHGAEYKEQRIGSFGDISCFSFFGSKIVTCGEGGACLTNDSARAARMRLLRDHGLVNGPGYIHAEVGYNYRMTNMQAAIGCAQMERIDAMLRSRDDIRRQYRARLQGHPRVRVSPPVQLGREVCWIETIAVDTSDIVAMIRYLREQGIETRSVFSPLNGMPLYAAYSCEDARSSGAEWCRGLSLPTFVGLSAEEIDEVCDAVISYLSREA